MCKIKSVYLLGDGEERMKVAGPQIERNRPGKLNKSWAYQPAGQVWINRG